MELLLTYLIGINIITILMMAIDKHNARKNGQSRHQRRRIPEKTLLTIAFFGGAVGIFLGMKLFRHKTKHASFIYLPPLFIIFHIVAVVTYTVLFVD